MSRTKKVKVMRHNAPQGISVFGKMRLSYNRAIYKKASFKPLILYRLVAQRTMVGIRKVYNLNAVIDLE